MAPTAGDLQRVHALFGEVQELLERRRAIFRLSIGLADESADGANLPVDVLDNPVVRGHLGEVLSGVTPYDATTLCSLDGLVTTVGRREVAGQPVRVVSAPASAGRLAGALSRLDAELARRAGDCSSALVLDDAPGFSAVMATVVRGIEMAVEIAPELALDLLPHVAMFGVLRAELASRLGSASLREFPGLVLLPEPGSPREVAEALVHEGAHQKFFDLALARSILGAPAGDRFLPPWAADDAPAWPFDQCVAAFHAYCCLAAFAESMGGAHIDTFHPYSLLPMAAERAEVLGDWLLGNGHLLGVDGRTFVSALHERDFPMQAKAGDVEELLWELTDSDHPVATHRCGDWTLVIQWKQPAAIFWTSTRHAGSLC